MLKERIKEVFDFTKSESPYRKANKGWINKDIFLDLSPSADTFKQTNEAAKITLFWSPINIFLSNIFLIIILCSIFVFTSLSFAKGRFDFNFINNYSIIDSKKDEANKALNISELDDTDSISLIVEENLDTEEVEKVNSLDDDLMKADQKIINQEINKKDSLIIEKQNNKDIKIIQSNKQKSNFI